MCWPFFKQPHFWENRYGLCLVNYVLIFLLLLERFLFYKTVTGDISLKLKFIHTVTETWNFMWHLNSGAAVKIKLKGQKDFSRCQRAIIELSTCKCGYCFLFYNISCWYWNPILLVVLPVNNLSELQSWQKPMGKSIKTPPPKFNVVFIGIFVVFKWDFLRSTKYCFLNLIFWGCHSKRFHLKTTKWKFLLPTFPEYQSKKRSSSNIASRGGGRGSIT